MKYQVLTAASMTFRVFWDVAPCSHVEFYRRFIGVYCLHHQGTLMEAVRTSETSVKFNMSTWRYIPEGSKPNRTFIIAFTETLHVALS
jgi:hypothetical protein